MKLTSFKVKPCINWVAIFATGLPIAFETNGTVLDALGFASRINNLFSSLFKLVAANCKLIKPITFSLFAIYLVQVFTLFIVDGEREIGGKQQAESPE